MKNLTRILALVLVFSLMISSAAFAASFTDIEDGSAVDEATHVLADLGILFGYEDGSFGPDKTITRAELVAVANRLQGLSDAAKAAGGVTAYTDVPADEWFAGDVNLATQMGIISGDGNGLFRPNDPVKYEEAIKMIVAALGYTQKYATEKGGWPTGYLVIATEAGVTKGLSNTAGTEAPRGIVARLAFNALTAPRMVLTEYASDGTAVYAPNTANILLDDKLGTFRLEGTVDANGISAIDGTKAMSAMDEVKFSIDEKVGSWADAFGNVVNNQYVTNANATLVVGETDAADHLGLCAHAYVQENEDGEWEIVSFVVQNKKNVTAVIENTGDIRDADNTNPGVKYASKIGTAISSSVPELYLSVYNEDNDSTNVEYHLDEKANVIVNGKYLAKVTDSAVLGKMHTIGGGTGNDLGNYYAPQAGKVTLLDNDNDGDYDIVFVTSYETVIVDEVYASNTKISAQHNGGVIDLANHIEGKDGYTYSITLDGEEIDIADLQKDDVLSVAATKDGNSVEILVTRATVEGVIDELDTNSADKSEWIFKVDGQEYVIANMNYMADSNLDGVTPGDEGIIYLDAFGKIAYFNKTSATSKNYGFVVGAGEYASVGDKTYEVQILDKDGTIATYTLADNVRVTDYNTPGNTGSKTAEWVYTNKIAGMAFGGVNGTWVLKSSDGTKATRLANYAGRLVTYTVNSSAKISAISFAKTDGADKNEFNFNDAYTGIDAKFNGNTGSINNVGVTEDTVVFSLPVKTTSAKDDFEVASIDLLADGDQYDIAFFNIDEDGNAGAVIITNNSALVGKGSSLAVLVKLMATKNDNDEQVYNVTFIQDGEEKTYKTTNELYTILEGNGYVRGDVFEYALNAQGEMSKVAFGNDDSVMFIAGDALANYTPNAGDAVMNNVFDADASTNVAQYVFGAVYSKASGRTIQIANYVDGTGTVSLTGARRHKISDDANIVVVDLAKGTTSSARVKVGAFGDIQATFVKDGKVDDDRDVAVLLKYYKGEVTDVIVYLNYAQEALDTNIL